MSLRVVVYAEGAGELGGEWAPPAAPGELLRDRQLGPAHVLAARSIESVRQVPTNAIRFEQGLRKSNTVIPRGSDLIHRKTLLRLLTWPLYDMRPELAIVFVDEDGERTRHATLSEWVKELHPSRPPIVIAVARQEFESWLVTDRACVAKVLGRSLHDGGDPEDWPPVEAKRTLQRAIDELRGPTLPPTHDFRREICATCELAELKRGSRSFERFLGELASA